MNTPLKVIALVVCVLLIAGALVIRHQEAGYLAYLKGDYKTAEIEFSKRQDNPEGWESYFVGLLHHLNVFGMRDPNKAAAAFLKSAELGNVDGAFRYLEFIGSQKKPSLNCSIFRELIDRAVKTHNFLALHVKAEQINSETCFVRNPILFAHLRKWGGELSPGFGSNFANIYKNMTASERQNFEEFKFIKPKKIDDAEFLEFFFGQLKEIQIN